MIIIVTYFDYHCIIHNISKSEAINLLKSAVNEKRGYIKKYRLNFQPIQEKFSFTIFM